MSKNIHPLKGLQIGQVDCPSCGTEKPLKVNAAGCVYFFCREPVGERGGKREDCFTRFNWGRVASEKMINEFMENKEEILNHAESKNREEQGSADSAAGRKAVSGEVAGADTQQAGETDGAEPKRGILDQLFGDWDE